MKRWWERWPGRLAHELNELDRAAIPYERDEAAFGRGTLMLRLRPEVDGAALELVALFPASYPYLRLEVYAPGLRLEHHQHPYAGNLCLFGRDSGEWHPSDTLASIITERIPLVLLAGRAAQPTEAAQVEEHQAEPVSYYLEYAAGGVFLVDSAWELGAARRGHMELVLQPGAWPLRGAVAEVKGEGIGVTTADAALLRTFGPNARTLQARWVRLSERPPSADPGAILDAVISEFPDLARPHWKQTGGPLVDVAAVVFPEEIAWRTTGDGWLFLVRYQDRAGRPPGVRAHVIRAARAGKGDLTPRITELAELTRATVAVVGLGALGAQSAIELAKAGVGRLHLLDFDHVDAGITPRWPLGMCVAGQYKTQAIQDFLVRHYPYTETLAWQHRLGAPEAGDAELELLDVLLDGVDLIYDASAEIGVQHLLSDVARERGLTYMCVSATHGAWGGMVARIEPLPEAACWMCFQLSLADGSIQAPPADPSNLIQPPGCASPTFTGAGFELAHVVFAGVRSVVGRLAPGSSFAHQRGDLLVISLRNDGGIVRIPDYRESVIVRHPDCRNIH